MTREETITHFTKEWVDRHPLFQKVLTAYKLGKSDEELGVLYAKAVEAESKEIQRLIDYTTN